MNDPIERARATIQQLRQPGRELALGRRPRYLEKFWQCGHDCDRALIRTDGRLGCFQCYLDTSLRAWRHRQSE